MIVTTTPTVEGYRITGYYGIVFGEVITGINFLKDFGAGIRNLVGGRSAGYEEELMVARTQALEELQQRAAALGAHAIVGVDMDYEVLGQVAGRYARPGRRRGRFLHEIYRYERLRRLTSPFDTRLTLISSSISAFRRS